MLSWTRDQRGSVIIEFVLVLPILVLIFYATVSIWKVVTIKDSLTSATYQAARHLSVRGRWDERLNPRENRDAFPELWREEASGIILRELNNSPFFATLVFTDTVDVIVGRPYPDPFRPVCPPPGAASPFDGPNKRYVRNSLFFVQANLEMAAPPIPFLLAGESRLTLSERHFSYMECEPLLPEPPTPTPTLPVPLAGSWREGPLAEVTPTPQGATGDASSTGR